MDNVKNMLNIFFGKLRLEGGLAWFKKNRIRVLKAFVVAIFVILVIKFIIINIAGIKFLIGFLMLGIICGGLSSRRWFPRLQQKKQKNLFLNWKGSFYIIRYLQLKRFPPLFHLQQFPPRNLSPYWRLSCLKNILQVHKYFHWLYWYISYNNHQRIK